ncbi:Hypothetical protein, putative [Bodo saltans]|uniref:Uncharacterized protein n=1 Tax=Bodo saltans TaxID=75058 RepID=A0A0S4IMH0_BODSA|nr:Hypothetical protein, putative [Bodo saltans]|eukprot:CUF45753.1 Hypothetical protein, putative [Bodo saltans]
MLLETLIAQTATKQSGHALNFSEEAPSITNIADGTASQDNNNNNNNASRTSSQQHPMFRALLNPLPRRKPTDHEKRMSVVQLPDHHQLHRNAAPTASSTMDSSSLSPSSTEEDKVDLLLRLGAFEARKAAATSSSNAHKVAVDISAKELRVLHFLASVDHGKDRPEIGCNVDTRNFRLQWILNPAIHRTEMVTSPTKNSPAGASSGGVASLNLMTLRTDIRYKDRKPPEHITTALLDSPRSILTCLRNGIQPMELQETPLDTMILEFASRGYQRDMIVKRHAFEETLRQHKLADLREEYRQLCNLLSLHDICTFFEFTALNDGLQAPNVVETTDGTDRSTASSVERKRNVIVSGDPTIFDAVRKIEERSTQDRKRLTTVLQQELDNTALRTEKFMRDQAKNAAKTRAHERELRLREDERRQAAAERKQRSEEKALRRAKLVEEASERKVSDILARQERAAQAEQLADEALRSRGEQRRERQDRKNEAQAIRLEQAEAKVEHIEVARRERFAEKQRLRDALMRQKEFLRERKKEEDMRANEMLTARRRDIAERGEAVVLEKLKRANEKTEQVHERMQEFAAQKASEMKFKKLVELRNVLNREEVFIENERRMQANIDHILERRHAHEISFQHFQEEQAAKRESIRERELQVLLMKEGDLRRHEQKHAYQLLLSAEECVRKLARANQLEDTRKDQSAALERERASMNLLRESALEESEKSMVAQERLNYLALFRESSPSDAKKLHNVNNWYLDMHRKAHHKHEQRTTAATPDPLQNLSDISVIRPSTSLDQVRTLPPL